MTVNVLVCLQKTMRTSTCTLKTTSTSNIENRKLIECIELGKLHGYMGGLMRNFVATTLYAVTHLSLFFLSFIPYSLSQQIFQQWQRSVSVSKIPKSTDLGFP